MANDGLLTLGERLSWALKDANITQSYFADQVGSTQAAVSQWCTGKKVPSAENLASIARLLRLNPTWLEGGVGPVRIADIAFERADYSRNSIWGFRAAPFDGGRDFGNANVWSFDPTIEVLVREVLQNALDAALPGGGTVAVKFRIIELRGADLTAYLDALKWSELKRHLEASTRNKQKLGSLIRDGLDSLAETGELVLLIADDSGTSGLLGPETGDGKFAALCRNNLDSNKEGAPTKGGAFGLGKGVLWRASRFATVTFCSNLSQPADSGHRHLRVMGRCDLPWHELPGEAFAGPGWFGRPNNAEQEYAVSFWDNEALARDLYLLREGAGSGTSACVVGFHDPSSDKPKSGRELAAEIEHAAAQHFFPAMAVGKLRVAVETYFGRSDYDAGTPASSVGVDVQQLQPEFSHALQAFREGAFAPALASPGDVVCKRVTLSVPARKVAPKHAECEHDALLLVRYAEEGEIVTQANRLAMFRGPGMVVSEQNLGGICLGSRPFHALLLCGVATMSEAQPADLAAEEFLRTAEPPSHNKWAATPELKAAYARGCVSTLTGFLDEVKETLRDVVKPVSRDLGDGPNSLRELFRIGTEPITVARERPRVVEQHGIVDGDGRKARWNVEARIRLKSSERETVITPAVVFVAETGGGTTVRWDRLEPISNCTVDGQDLRIPPRRREISFRGVTDPASHPVPAHDSSIIVDIRKVVQIAGGQP
jgi:transcriptional regulator with XRE-family HTH domain